MTNEQIFFEVTLSTHNRMPCFSPSLPWKDPILWVPPFLPMFSPYVLPPKNPLCGIMRNCVDRMIPPPLPHVSSEFGEGNFTHFILGLLIKVWAVKSCQIGSGNFRVKLVTNTYVYKHLRLLPFMLHSLFIWAGITDQSKHQLLKNSFKIHCRQI